MTTLVKIPANYDTVDPDKTVPSEGEHHVTVRSAQLDSGTGVKIRYQILDSSDKGMFVDQTYNLDNPYGVRLFKQLMVVLGREPENGAIDVEPIIGRQVIIDVAHREHDGTTYANVVEHKPSL